ncbi:uncharacterized protein LOC108134673 isoform X2 [Drosophila elegans]|uniref:uncharacterized protein LOC108134673 isoform X2 n=1 Tax=Drosophila elegans TaxID=30023 RepID=UPI0007E60496|nr:uncharacterized protein LOC108134673 isoform X2 [Drosophila elegans]XP_041564208.1 uncharacterized protein LOC108134673 isoform X2 [Drosophila elegans]XP_041564271.1 uncharacterized protein LOC108134673 isoform X2 [Drosophila elegans]
MSETATKGFELQSEAIFGPGDCIGDIDVMEDSPRTNTYIATTYCELLAVFNKNYKFVLQPYMQKLWQEKKAALRAIDYFNFLNEEQIVNASKYGTIQQFNPLETIYTEDLGSMSFVYFVLSGECVVLQCLHMKVSMVNRQKVFELALVPKRESGTLAMDDGSKINSAPFFDVNEYMQSSSSVDENNQSRKRGLRKMGLKEIQRACAAKKSPPRRSSKEQGRQRQRQQHRQREKGRQVERGEYELYITDEGEETYDNYKDLADDRYSENSGRQSPVTEILDIGIESETEGSEIFTASTTSLKATVEEGDGLEHYETHFVDVGSLTYGGIFGLGEKMDHRVIMARTKVQCILIPRFWLFEAAQNPGNFWQRQRFYIECNIPTRENLYKDFLKTRKWEKFRHDYIQNILNSDSLANFTKVEDIPIISRIVETKADES